MFRGGRGAGTRLALGQMLQVPEPPRLASPQRSKQPGQTCLEHCMIFYGGLGGGKEPRDKIDTRSHAPSQCSEQLWENCVFRRGRGPGTRLALSQMLQVPEPPRLASSQRSKQPLQTCLEICVIFLVGREGGKGTRDKICTVKCSKSPGPATRQLPMFKTSFAKVCVSGRQGGQGQERHSVKCSKSPSHCALH